MLFKNIYNQVIHFLPKKISKTIFMSENLIVWAGIRLVRGYKLTWYSVLSMPMRKSSSAMKRLMQRFLWMVLRSVCRPRRKQKVEMQMARHTREMTIPTQVITNRISSCIRPWY